MESRIWIFIFPDMENTGNLREIIKSFHTGNLPPTPGIVLKIKVFAWFVEGVAAIF